MLVILVPAMCLLQASCPAQEQSVPAPDSALRPHPDAEAAGMKPKVLNELDTALQKQIDDRHVSGVIGLLSGNDTIGYFESFGDRVIEKTQPMDKDTIFRLFSMTKPIVAVTAMSLWEEGKFKLDDPIHEYLPEWKDVRVLSGDGDPVRADRPVTVRHLLTHSAGLSYDRRRLAMGASHNLEAFSKSMAARPLEFQPGTSYRYGYSIDILGRYIEAVAGKGLDEVMRERIFVPLEMNDTDFWIRRKDESSRMAVTYTRRNGSLRPGMGVGEALQKPPRMMGGQGLYGTTMDYARFCQMIARKGELGGKRILKASTVELMCQNHLKDIRRTYGLGGMVDGKGLYFWGGAAGTKFWVHTASNRYAVFMIQRWGYEPPTYKVFQRITKEVWADEG